MHVLQWIAVREEEEDVSQAEYDAMSTVETFLNSELGGSDFATNSWYDWFVIGGGRWNPEQDPYASSPNMIVSIAKHNVEGIQEKVDWAIKARLEEYAHYKSVLERDGIDINAELDKYTGVMDYSFSLYSVNKMIDMLQGNWDFNSYFYDAEHHSTNPKHMLDKIASGDVNWYLVPVDFHF